MSNITTAKQATQRKQPQKKIIRINLHTYYGNITPFVLFDDGTQCRMELDDIKEAATEKLKAGYIISKLPGEKVNRVRYKT